MSDPVIRVVNLKKQYRRYRTNMQMIQNLLLKRDAGEAVNVLKGVSFEINKGEKVGIIGKPLSGRTTLMRVLAGIIVPSSGTVETDGKITALLDNRVGFYSTMSGRENYKIRAKLLGWSGSETEEREEKVFKAAGLEKEIDEPVNTYKRGSLSRLGFVISTVDRPEILLYDETFSLGSKVWSNRCVKRMSRLIKDDGITFIMTVNDQEIGANLCTRGLVLHNGKIVFDGPYDKAVAYYNKNCKIGKKNKTAEDAGNEAEGMESPMAEEPGAASSDNYTDDGDGMGM